MYRVFNMGLGMIAVVPDGLAAEVIDQLGRAGYAADRIGFVLAGEDPAAEPRVELVARP